MRVLACGRAGVLACGRVGICALRVPVSARASLSVCAGVYNVCVFLIESARACCAHIMRVFP